MRTKIKCAGVGLLALINSALASTWPVQLGELYTKISGGEIGSIAQGITVVATFGLIYLAAECVTIVRRVLLDCIIAVLPLQMSRTSGITGRTRSKNARQDPRRDRIPGGGLWRNGNEKVEIHGGSRLFLSGSTETSPDSDTPRTAARRYRGCSASPRPGRRARNARSSAPRAR